MNDWDAAFTEEHVFGAAQADAARAERVRNLGLVWLIGVGAHAQPAEPIRPLEQRVKALIDRRVGGLQLARDHLQNLARLRRHLGQLDLTREPVKGNVIAFLHRVTVHRERLAVLVNAQLASADHGRLAHLAANDGGVRGHAAGGGENALRHPHAVNVIGRGFAADQDDRFALVRPRHRGLGREHGLAAGRARRRRQAARDRLDALPFLLVEPWRQQLRQRFRVDEQDGFLGRDQLLFRHVGGDHDGGVAGALAAARLQHVELLVLDRELEVLDVLVVAFEPRGDVAQLLVRLRHHPLEFDNRLRRADAGDHVLALGVDQELAEEFLGAGGRIAREAHAGAGAIAGVAEHHHLNVDGGANRIRNVIDAAVFLGAGVVPRAEHGVAGAAQLLHRILWEGLLGVIPHHFLVGLDDLTQRRLVQVGIHLRAFGMLDGFEFMLERRLRYFEDDAAEHLHEAAIAVEREAAVAGPCLQAFNGLVIQAEVEDGVHHARHGELGARANRHEQGLLLRAKRGARGLLELAQLRDHFGLDVGRQLVAVG